jgi:hypothetical protein
MTTFTAPFVYPDHGHLIVETTSNDGLRSWRNSIDMVWLDSAGPPLYGDASVTAFINFLKGFQRADCHLSLARLAVWGKGNLPLADQPAYWEQPLSIACASTGAGTVYGGTATLGTTPIGEICVLLKKNAFGRAFRAGNMFIRNSVNQEYLAADTGGPPVLESSLDTSVPAAINSWCTDLLGAYCTDSALPRYVLVHAQKTGSNTWDVFDTAMDVPAYARITTHNISKKS